MPKKVNAQYRIKITKFTCDRCGLVVDGFRGEGFAAGIYDMASWEEYRRGNERYVRLGCLPIRIIWSGTAQAFNAPVFTGVLTISDWRIAQLLRS